MVAALKRGSESSSEEASSSFWSGLAAGAVRPARWNLYCSAGSRTSRIKVLLPDPLTPVRQTRRFSGILTARFLRLLAVAFEMRNVVDVLPLLLEESNRTGRRGGSSNFLRPARYWPVSECSDFNTSENGP